MLFLLTLSLSLVFSWFPALLFWADSMHYSTVCFYIDATPKNIGLEPVMKHPWLSS